MEKKKMNKALKIVLITLSSILGLIIILVAVIFGIWNKEIRSVFSITQLLDANEENHSGPVYKMDVKGDYYFADFLEKGGASNDQELIDHIVDNITKGIIPLEIKAPTIGCSSFTVEDEDGTRYFGRNYDFEISTSMILITEGDEKACRYATVSSVDLGFLGIKRGSELGLMDKALCLAAAYAPLDGINEAGVSCGIYMSYQGPTAERKATSTDQQTDRPDLTSTTMLRLVLDYADSVEEAVKLISQYDLHDSANTSFHYMIADASGTSAILEWVPVDGNSANDTDGTKRVLKVYFNDDNYDKEYLKDVDTTYTTISSDSEIGEKEANNSFQYITNFIITKDYYVEGANKGGYDRYEAIEEFINPDGTNTKGISTYEDALDLLELVGRRNWAVQTNATASDNLTVWSSLYNLTDKSVTWISNEEFTNEDAVYNISLKDGKFVFA